MGCNLVLRVRFAVRNPPFLYLYYLFFFPNRLLLIAINYSSLYSYFMILLPTSLSLSPSPPQQFSSHIFPPSPSLSLLSSLSLLKEEQMQLLKHISGLERQLGHLRAEREKLSAANKAVSVQQGRDNTCLRNNLAQVCHYLYTKID